MATPAGGSVTAGSVAKGEERAGIIARTRRGRNGRITGCTSVAARIIAGWGSTQWNPSQCRNRVPRGRVGSTCSRAASIILPNGTWEGQTSSHARHTRHRSMKAANDDPGSAPAATARIAAIRPRGEAASSPVMR